MNFALLFTENRLNKFVIQKDPLIIGRILLLSIPLSAHQILTGSVKYQTMNMHFHYKSFILNYLVTTKQFRVFTSVRVTFLVQGVRHNIL